jgi:hypothetical protein
MEGEGHQQPERLLSASHQHLGERISS